MRQALAAQDLLGVVLSGCRRWRCIPAADVEVGAGDCQNHVASKMARVPLQLSPPFIVRFGYAQDSFYRRFKGSPFPEAIEANGSELAAVTQKV